LQSVGDENMDEEEEVNKAKLTLLSFNIETKF
jgi:hypothetical protein